MEEAIASSGQALWSRLDAAGGCCGKGRGSMNLQPGGAFMGLKHKQGFTAAGDTASYLATWPG